eukprot:7097-Eustigmatos_ZCMA.PRE.1
MRNRFTRVGWHLTRRAAASTLTQHSRASIAARRRAATSTPLSTLAFAHVAPDPLADRGTFEEI